jgi:hypothetical protein
MICVAQEHAVECPKKFDPLVFNRDCLIELENPDGLNDKETYKP